MTLEGDEVDEDAEKLEEEMLSMPRLQSVLSSESVLIQFDVRAISFF